jgi:cellulose synthase/poly-beta-1,6-N-acetylglucosamine synthase-like glycosyltransferase
MLRSSNEGARCYILAVRDVPGENLTPLYRRGEESRDRIFDGLRLPVRIPGGHVHILLALAVAGLILWIGLGLDLALGSRSIVKLRDEPPGSGESLPKVSIVIAARNEERKIEEALTSILNLDYPNLEIVVVNDRSTDGTGAVLARMAERDRRLRVLTLAELPPGWLGKNYALDRGAAISAGELLLFTDADVVMEPAVLRRAVSYFSEHKLDHLPIMPEIRTPGAVLGSFVVAFSVCFSLFARPWRARSPGSRMSIGVGAFNMVRADVYRAVGGYRAIAMRPDDDLRLGKLLKSSGYRQELLSGTGMIWVEWYSSLRELVEGAEKNAFAVLDYSLPRMAASYAAFLFVFVWPFLSVAVTRGLAQVLSAATSVLILALAWDMAHQQKIKQWYALAFPLSALFFLCISIRSSLVTLYRGGIRWRGTFYSLRELRANKG